MIYPGCFDWMNKINFSHTHTQNIYQFHKEKELRRNEMRFTNTQTTGFEKIKRKKKPLWIRMIDYFIWLTVSYFFFRFYDKELRAIGRRKTKLFHFVHCQIDKSKRITWTKRFRCKFPVPFTQLLLLHLSRFFYLLAFTVTLAFLLTIFFFFFF